MELWKFMDQQQRPPMPISIQQQQPQLQQSHPQQQRFGKSCLMNLKQPPHPPQHHHSHHHQMNVNSSNNVNSNSTSSVSLSAPTASINNGGGGGGGGADITSTQQPPPQYRIFKRGDSIPGISSPLQISAQCSDAGSGSEGGKQNNNIKNSNSNETSADNDKWDDNNPPVVTDAAGNSPNGDKENSNTNLQSSSGDSNSKEGQNTNNALVRTPLSQIGEIARFHGLQVEYRLVKETGPPHAPTFTVLLRLGNEEYTGEGPSIKKAQHAAAVEALEKTKLTRPPPKSKPKKSFNPIAGGGGAAGRRPNWALIQLNNLAQEMQLPLQFVQQPVAIVDPFRRGEPPSVVSVHVGERIFTGEGSNFSAAKNMAVMIALKAMIKVKQELDVAKLVQAGAEAEQSMMDLDNKSPISIVHEMAMKRGLPVAFEIVQESGPPHMKVFTVKCKVGEELETEGEGPTKQAAKKVSSELMIAKLREIPLQLPVSCQGLNLKAVQRGLLRQKMAKKKTSTPVLKDLEKHQVSPISKLIQICHIKKLKEPEFKLISTGTETNVESFLKQITERDRRMLRKKKPVFTIEVTVGSHACRGTGPNKKAAKKAAAEAAIIALGYGTTDGATDEVVDGEEKSAQESAGTAGAVKSDQKSVNSANTGSTGNASSAKGASKGKGEAKSGNNVKLAGARQIAPGVIVLKQESSGSGATSSAAAQEMKKVNTLMTSPTSSNGAGGGAGGQSSREGIEKLAYLSKLLDISVSYSDFPKKNEYLSVVSLTTNPPHVAHGCGATLEEAQNAAALKILEELSTMDLDSVTAAAEKN